MRCDEIRERFVELLYDDTGASGEKDDLRAHVDACPSCRAQIEELREVRGLLREWRDEPPLRPIAIPDVRPVEPARVRRFDSGLRTLVRYGAIAAALVLAFLAGVTYRSSTSATYYTKSEVRELIKRALDDSEVRLNETTNLKLQRVLDTVENEQGYMYDRLTRYQTGRNRIKN